MRIGILIAFNYHIINTTNNKLQSAMETSNKLGKYFYAKMFGEMLTCKRILNTKIESSNLSHWSHRSSNHQFKHNFKNKSAVDSIDGPKQKANASKNRLMGRPNSAFELLRKYEKRSVEQLSSPYNKVHKQRDDSPRSSSAPKSKNISSDRYSKVQEGSRYEQIKSYYERKYCPQFNRATPTHSKKQEAEHQHREGKLRKSFW